MVLIKVEEALDMTKYKWIQLIAGIYIIIYVSALYFASGVHTGFKLDDNQLTGYVICGMMFFCLVLSAFITSKKMQKLFSVFLVGFTFVLWGVIIFDIVSFNEAFIYFIFFIKYIPFILLFETVLFLKNA